MSSFGLPLIALFLSTPSARRATLSGFSRVYLLSYFYPRPPRGGRPPLPPERARIQRISIHALREEGDSSCCARSSRGGRFLSTPSARRATTFFRVSPMPTRFLSTPSARRATDGVLLTELVEIDFYPRPPRGGRRVMPVRSANVI